MPGFGNQTLLPLTRLSTALPLLSIVVLAGQREAPARRPEVPRLREEGHSGVVRGRWMRTAAERAPCWLRGIGVLRPVCRAAQVRRGVRAHLGGPFPLIEHCRAAIKSVSRPFSVHRLASPASDTGDDDPPRPDESRAPEASRCAALGRTSAVAGETVPDAGMPARDIPSYPRARCREHHHYRSIPVISVMTDARSSYIRRRHASEFSSCVAESRVACFPVARAREVCPRAIKVGGRPVSCLLGIRVKDSRAQGLRGSGGGSILQRTPL